MTKMENIVKQIREGLVLDFMILNIYSLNIYIYTHTHTHTYFGEGNGTPLQYSCLENPMDRGAW